MDEEEYEISWSLGNDSDCETCGWSYNTASFEIEPDTSWAWQFSYSVGCYGGDHVMGDNANWKSKLEDMFDHLARYEGWNAELEEAVWQKIKAAKDNG